MYLPVIIGIPLFTFELLLTAVRQRLSTHKQLSKPDIIFIRCVVSQHSPEHLTTFRNFVCGYENAVMRES